MLSADEQTAFPKQRVPVQKPFFYWARRVGSLRYSAVYRGFNSLSNAIRFIGGNISEKKSSLLDHPLYALSLCDRKRSFFLLPIAVPKYVFPRLKEGSFEKKYNKFVCLSVAGKSSKNHGLRRSQMLKETFA